MLSSERAVNAVLVVVIPKFGQLARQVKSIPEVYPIEVLTPDRFN
jgi:hypothetical protein